MESVWGFVGKMSWVYSKLVRSGGMNGGELILFVHQELLSPPFMPHPNEFTAIDILADASYHHRSIPEMAQTDLGMTRKGAPLAERAGAMTYHHVPQHESGG